MAVVAPTLDKMLQVKAYLVVQRNVVRDYLDVVALADHMGLVHAAEVLWGIDDYYDDRYAVKGSVRTSLVLVLVAPRPLDVDVIRELPRYHGLDPKWHGWSSVVAAGEALALEVAESSAPSRSAMWWLHRVTPSTHGPSRRSPRPWRAGS